MKALIAILLVATLIGCPTTRQVKVFKRAEVQTMNLEDAEQELAETVASTTDDKALAEDVNPDLVESDLVEEGDEVEGDVVKGEPVDTGYYAEVPPDMSWWQYLIVTVVVPALISAGIMLLDRSLSHKDAERSD